MPYRRTALLLVLALGVLGGCTSSPDTTGPLPEGGQLVRTAADRLTQLRTVRFTLGVSGAVPGLEVREVEGVAAVEGGRFGWARGKADVQRDLERVQVDFVLEGDRLSLTRKQGVPQPQPVPEHYAPTALLTPGDGLRTLLTSATGLETEGKETVNDTEAFRVAGKIAGDVVSTVVPGISSDVDVKFWVGTAEPRDLVRLWMQVPPRKPKEGAVMLELALSDHNKPVAN